MPATTHCVPIWPATRPLAQRLRHPFALRTVAACVLLCAASASFASPEDEAELALAFGDKEFISLATGAKQPLRRAPAVATVITAHDIAAMGATDLDEVLETVPGIHVSRASVTYQPIYVVRGIFSTPTNPQVLMLQNGVPMTTLYSGDKGNAWGGLTLHNIARIEVIRGPGSALYGADAYAGVINLITKTAADVDGTEFGTRVGAFNGKEAWVQHGGKLGAVDVATYLHWGKTDGHKELLAQDIQTTRDTATGTSASRAPGPVNTAVNTLDASMDLGLDQWRLRLGYKGRDHLGLYVGGASALDPDSYGKSERTNADLSWTAPQWAPDVGVGVLASYLSWVERYDDTNIMLSPGHPHWPQQLPQRFYWRAEPLGALAAPLRLHHLQRLQGPRPARRCRARRPGPVQDPHL